MSHRVLLPVADPQIIEELRCWLDARNEQMISRARAGDVQELALRLVHVLEVCVVRDGFDALLLRQHFVITGSDNHGAKLKPLREVHSADCDCAHPQLFDPVKLLRFEVSGPHSVESAADFGVRANEDADLVRLQTLQNAVTEPSADAGLLLLEGVGDANLRICAVEG